MVRSVVLELEADGRLDSFRVEAVNDESIHNHAAFARYTGPGWSDIACGKPR
jgi:GTP cyclohydrolase FolE2